MSHKEERTQVDKWEVDVCDNCGHEKGQHYDEPLRVDYPDGRYMYTAFGCMALYPEIRRLKGDNPYLRCPCVKFV